jgi:hypothetical protein
MDAGEYISGLPKKESGTFEQLHAGGSSLRNLKFAEFRVADLV